MIKQAITMAVARTFAQKVIMMINSVKSANFDSETAIEALDLALDHQIRKQTKQNEFGFRQGTPLRQAALAINSALPPFLIQEDSDTIKSEIVKAMVAERDRVDQLLDIHASSLANAIGQCIFRIRDEYRTDAEKLGHVIEQAFNDALPALPSAERVSLSTALEEFDLGKNLDLNSEVRNIYSELGYTADIPSYLGKPLLSNHFFTAFSRQESTLPRNIVTDNLLMTALATACNAEQAQGEVTFSGKGDQTPRIIRTVKNYDQLVNFAQDCGLTDLPTEYVSTSYVSNQGFSYQSLDESLPTAKVSAKNFFVKDRKVYLQLSSDDLSIDVSSKYRANDAGRVYLGTLKPGESLPMSISPMDVQLSQEIREGLSDGHLDQITETINRLKDFFTTNVSEIGDNLRMINTATLTSTSVAKMIQLLPVYKDQRQNARSISAMLDNRVPGITSEQSELLKSACEKIERGSVMAMAFCANELARKKTAVGFGIARGTDMEFYRNPYHRTVVASEDSIKSVVGMNWKEAHNPDVITLHENSFTDDRIAEASKFVHIERDELILSHKRDSVSRLANAIKPIAEKVVSDSGREMRFDSIAYANKIATKVVNKETTYDAAMLDLLVETREPGMGNMIMSSFKENFLKDIESATHTDDVEKRRVNAMYIASREAANAFIVNQMM